MNNIIKKKKLPRQPPKIMDLFRSRHYNKKFEVDTNASN